MELSLFSLSGVDLLLAWVHLLAGVAWIGMLYYFNLVHVPFMAEADAATKPGVVLHLLPRALKWFRYGAVFTLLSGLAILGVKIAIAGPAIMSTSWGVGISLGATLGIVMFFNVWLVIWPKQQIVIANQQALSAGQPALPQAAPAAMRAFMVSRTNLLFSIPMLFFMANHRISLFETPKMKPGMVLGICTLLIVLFEVLGVVGTRGKGPAKMLEKPVAVIHVGLVLTLLMYVILDVML